MVYFVSRNKLRELIRNNDSYYERFCASDWRARNALNRQDYVKQVLTGSFIEEHRLKLRQAVKRAKQILPSIYVDWFDGGLVSKMPWKIGCIVSEDFENGLPHTIDDTIVLTWTLVDQIELPDLIKLLIHEQTHVFQRKFPKYVRNFMRQYGYRRIKKHTKHDRIRANPDTDGYIYERKGRRTGFKYATNRPVRSLHTLLRRQHPRLEHPFEDMAYRVEKLVDEVL